MGNWIVYQEKEFFKICTLRLILFLDPLYLDNKIYILYLQGVLKIHSLFLVPTTTPLRAGYAN